MAKSKRTIIGSVIKSNDPTKPDYIKFNLKMVAGGVLTIKDGQTVAVETKKYQTESLQKAIQSGKVSEDFGAKIQSRIDKIPDFVRGEIILIEKT